MYLYHSFNLTNMVEIGRVLHRHLLVSIIDTVRFYMIQMVHSSGTRAEIVVYLSNIFLKTVCDSYKSI